MIKKLLNLAAVLAIAGTACLSFSCVKNDVDNVKTDLKKLQSESDAQAARLTAVESTITILQSTVDALKKQTSENTEAIAACEDAIKDLRDAMVLSEEGLTAAMQKALEALEKAYKAADEELKKDLDEQIAEVKSLIAKVASDLSCLITSIEYQGTNANKYKYYKSEFGTKRYDWNPWDDGFVAYARLEEDFEDWPNENVEGYVPAKEAGRFVVIPRDLYAYVTINPSTINFKGQKLSFENSGSVANKYAVLGAAEPTSDLLVDKTLIYNTKADAGTAGLYRMAIYPTDSIEVILRMAYSNGKSVELDRSRYGLVASWYSSDSTLHKTTSTYSITWREMETWMREAPSVGDYDDKKLEKEGYKGWGFKGYEMDTLTVVSGCDSTGFESDFEFVASSLTGKPEGFIKIDSAGIRKDIYKWYIVFKCSTEAGEITLDPTKVFEDYKDEVMDSTLAAKHLKLKDTTYLNKLITCEVHALGYDYGKDTIAHTISFTRPLIAAKTFRMTHTPASAETQTVMFDSYLSSGFTAFEKSCLQKSYSNGVIEKVSGDTATLKLTFDPSRKPSPSYYATYDPKTVKIGKDSNVVVYTASDKYGHMLWPSKAGLTTVVKIENPDHLDALTKPYFEGKRIDASWGFEYEDIKFGKDTIVVWVSGEKVEYNLNGAFSNPVFKVANADKAGKGGWTKSNNSVYDVVVPSDFAPVDTTDCIVRPAVVDSAVIDIYKNNVSSGRVWQISHRVNYYDTKRFYSATDKDFKYAIIFLSPINYGIDKVAGNAEAPLKHILTVVADPNPKTYNFDARLKFPDYSKAGGKTFSLFKNGLVKGYVFSIDKSKVSGNNIALLGGEACYMEKDGTFHYTYTNTSAIKSFDIPMKISVTDIWGVKTEVDTYITIANNEM